MFRLLALAVLVTIVGLTGCHHKPFLVRGDIDIGGDIAASLKPDNTASRLRSLLCSCWRIALRT